MSRGRSSELIHLRNNALVARYYYWNDIWEKNYYVVIMNLSLHEFFIAESTIENEINDNEDYLLNLRASNPDIKKLACQYPGFSWNENMKVAKPNKKQLTLQL